MIDQLTSLGAAADRETIAALRDRLGATRLRVLVVGEAKRGKSTLVNALLGREVLPTGVIPVTALATTVTYGADEVAEVVFRDGRKKGFPLAALEDFVTERGNPANARSVASVAVRLDAPILARGVEIVDTPGTGSVHAHNTDAADSVLATMDAAVFVLTADSAVSASERELLGRVAEFSVTTFVVLNKADYLDDAGVAEALAFTARVAREAAGQAVRVYPVPARAAMQAHGDKGFGEFAADFIAYLQQGRVFDLQRSVAGQLRRMAESLLDEVTLAQRAAQMSSSAAAERVTAFAKCLAAVRERGRDTPALAAAESARLLAGLNAAAEREAARLAAELRNQVCGLLDGELAGAPPAEIERRGRGRLAEMAKDAAESWRQAQQVLLERGLSRLGTRLAAELAAELDTVRAAAAELLMLDLRMPGQSERLAPDRRFFYTLGENVDQAELLAGAVRRRLPGQLGRRTARLASALDAAAGVRAATAGQAEARRSELALRERDLRDVLAQLDQGCEAGPRSR